MARILRLKIPKPRNCLGLIDLQTAAEMITIFTLINKVSGFYGILSLFTGTQGTSQIDGNVRRANIRIADEHVYLVNLRHCSLSMGL